MQGERALQGHRVEGYSRAVMTQVSEARIEGYEIQALETPRPSRAQGEP